MRLPWILSVLVCLPLALAASGCGGDDGGGPLGPDQDDVALSRVIVALDSLFLGEVEAALSAGAGISGQQLASLRNAVALIEDSNWPGGLEGEAGDTAKALAQLVSTAEAGEDAGEAAQEAATRASEFADEAWEYLEEQGISRPAAHVNVANPWAEVADDGTVLVYFTLEGGQAPDQLTGVGTPAGQAAIARMSFSGGVPQFTARDGVSVPAAASVDFAPGNLVVRVTGLGAAPAPGETVAIELTFSKAGTVAFDAVVMDTSPPPTPTPTTAPPPPPPDEPDDDEGDGGGDAGDGGGGDGGSDGGGGASDGDARPPIRG